jgi:hypothetical protein
MRKPADHKDGKSVLANGVVDRKPTPSLRALAVQVPTLLQRLDGLPDVALPIDQVVDEVDDHFVLTSISFPTIMRVPVKAFIIPPNLGV